jgi:ElaB/YqjD/DUF883 family membrane-anchored ribosome-binding protein
MKRAQALETLVDDVKELLDKISDEQEPAIKELRGRIEDAINSTKHARKSASAHIGRYAKTVDRYITGYPRLGFLTGLIVGGLIVYAAGFFGSEDSGEGSEESEE